MSESPFIVEVTTENFYQLLATSQQIPVLVDFWAEWCQPCKILMPVLAQLAEEYHGKFLLAKLNTEEQQELAGQFGIRSIPTVKLFRDGQPVDEFLGALPEAEIRRFLDQHIPRESDTLVARARQQLLAGDGAGALQQLTEARQSDPDNPRVPSMLAQAQAALGDVQAALATLDELPLEEQHKPEIASLRSKLYFEGLVADAPAVAELERRLADDDADSEARFLLAIRNIVDQEHERAMQALLRMLQQDRQFGDDAARKALLKLFELLGDDPLVTRYRARLASLLH